MEKLLQVFSNSSSRDISLVPSDESHRVVHNEAEEARTMTTVITSTSPHKSVATRTLPYNSPSARHLVATKFGTSSRAIFTNPLDTARPDIIYHHPHHYDHHLSDNVYETISHCKNLKNSVI